MPENKKKDLSSATGEAATQAPIVQSGLCSGPGSLQGGAVFCARVRIRKRGAGHLASFVISWAVPR